RVPSTKAMMPSLTSAKLRTRCHPKYSSPRWNTRVPANWIKRSRSNIFMMGTYNPESFAKAQDAKNAEIFGRGLGSKKHSQAADGRDLTHGPDHAESF